MKCPLFILSDRRVWMGEETKIGDCNREQCAWYCAVDQACAINVIAHRLINIDQGSFTQSVPIRPPRGGK